MKVILLSDLFGAGAGKFKKGPKFVIGDAKILDRFSNEDENGLGKEIIDYIYSLPRGNKLEPLDQDTVYFSTTVRPSRVCHDGTVTSPERVLYIDLPYPIPGDSCRTFFEISPTILPDGTQISKPLTLDSVKEAIEHLFLLRKQRLAVHRYAKCPNEENEQAVLKLYPPEFRDKNILEFVTIDPALLSALE